MLEQRGNNGGGGGLRWTGRGVCVLLEDGYWDRAGYEGGWACLSGGLGYFILPQPNRLRRSVFMSD